MFINSGAISDLRINEAFEGSIMLEMIYVRLYYHFRDDLSKEINTVK